MGLAFSRIWERMFGKKEMRILMVGLDGHVLCGNQPVCRVHFLGDDAAVLTISMRISFLPNMRSQMRENARPMVDLPF